MANDKIRIDISNKRRVSKCKYNDPSTSSKSDSREHDKEYDLKASTNVFITSDGKKKFLCSVRKYYQRYAWWLKAK